MSKSIVITCITYLVPKSGVKGKERLQGHFEGNSEQNPGSQITSQRGGLCTELREAGVTE